MFMKSFLSTNTCLISVTIQIIQSFLIRLIKVIGKMKDESEGKIIGQFVGLKSNECILWKLLMVKYPIRQKE